MKIAALISRLLLGLIFLVFGLNGFLNFIPMPPPTGVAGQFFGAIFASRYWVVIFGIQILGGLLLLINRFVPLALTLLGPSHREYLFLSRADGAGGASVGHCGGDSVDHPRGAEQAALRGNLCSTRGIMRQCLTAIERRGHSMEIGVDKFRSGYFGSGHWSDHRSGGPDGTSAGRN